MIRYGVNSDRPGALDLLPVELYPWYRMHYAAAGGDSCDAHAAAWKAALETEPTDERKREGIELLRLLSCRPRTPWAHEMLRGTPAVNETEVDAGGPRRSAEPAPEPPASTPRRRRRRSRYAELVGRVVDRDGRRFRICSTHGSDGAAAKAAERARKRGKQRTCTMHRGVYVTLEPTDELVTVGGPEAKPEPWETPDYFLT